MKMLSTMLKTFLASKRKGPCPSSILECPLFPLESQPETVGLSWRRFPGWNLGLANGFPMLVDFRSSDQCCSVFRATVYWSSIFVLPKEVCKVIDQILRSFLWHGAVGISKAAKVAWDVVYPPKGEGGLSWPQESS